MFEKEAESYATRECCMTCNNINHFCKEKCECWTFAKKGAEFGYNKCNTELEKENAELKSKNCWKTCEYAEPKSQWISQHIQDVAQLSKAKEIIRDLLQVLPKENIEGIYEITEEAEQFIRED